MLRIILIIGNASLLIYLFTIPIYNNTAQIKFIIFILLALLNIYFIKTTYSGSLFLSNKRKKLEEEIKIREAENKLKDLQLKKPDSLKEKNKNGII